MNEKNLITEYKDPINTLISPDERYVFLVGAGISIDPPTNLLPATQFINYLLELCAPEEEMHNLLSIESLRYEMIVEIIQRYIDYELEFMNYFELIDQPNINHLFIAQSIIEGHSVYTTNFDYLIEYALMYLLPEEKNKHITPVITKEDYIEFRNPIESHEKGHFPVYKLHGAKKNVIQKIKTTDSLITTMSAFGKGEKFLSLESYKKESVVEISRDGTLIVMGYSGRDDFDIAPMLRQLHEVKRIIWVEHETNEQIEIYEFNPKRAFVIPKGLPQTERLLAEISSNTDAEVFMVKTHTGNLIKSTLWPLLFANKKIPDLPSRESAEKDSEQSFKTYLDNKFTSIPTILKWKSTADIYLELGFIDDFLRCAKTGLERAREEDSKRMESEFLNLLGIYHYNQKEFDKSLQYYEAALKIDEESKNDPLKAVRLNNIGLVMLEKGELNKALDYFEQALEIAKMRGDYRGMASRTNNIGVVLFKQNNFEGALDKYNEALELDKRIGNLAGRSIRLKNIGDIYKTQNNYSEALTNYKNSYQIIQKLEDRVQLGKILIEIGKTYLELKDYGKAITNLKTAIVYLKEIGDTVNLEEAENTLKQVKAQLQ